jgi:pimeloyl-ACP methyl ester carboxylesterase
MTAIARHLMYFRSSVDGADLPYLVCAPAAESAAAGRLPVVFLLHDHLRDPSPGGFIEEAFRRAAHWESALRSSCPALLIQPFGRGNAGWLGVAARDIFDVWEHVRHAYCCDPDAVSLVGIGAGGTGALQLAGWRPDRFSAIAAIGAWTDDRFDLPIGMSQWPVWEQPQRLAVNPLFLANNLTHMPIYLEHPWWFNGLSGTAGRAHYDAMVAQLSSLGVSPRTVEQPIRVSAVRTCPSAMDQLWAWLISARRKTPLPSVRFCSGCLRSATCDWIGIVRLLRPEKAGFVQAQATPAEQRLKTKNVQALAVRLLGPHRLRVDRQSMDLRQYGDGYSGRWIRLERVGNAWNWHDAQLHDEPWPASSTLNAAASLRRQSSATGRRIATNAPTTVKSPTLPGPVIDLFTDRILLVPGTLGDDAENGVMRQLAETLQNSWRTGCDSLNPYPGDRRSQIETAILNDTDLTAEDSARHHLVLIGNPRTNLVLGRLAGRLPCRWPDTSGAVELTATRQRRQDPELVLLLLCPNPEAPHRYAFIVTSQVVGALASVSELRMVYLPDFFLTLGRRVVDWGYFGADWRTPIA